MPNMDVSYIGRTLYQVTGLEICTNKRPYLRAIIVDEQAKLMAFWKKIACHLNNVHVNPKWAWPKIFIFGQ